MIHLWFGDDTWSMLQELALLKDKEEVYFGDLPDKEVRTQVGNHLESGSLFSTQKLVVLRDFLPEVKNYPLTQSYLEQILPHLSGSTDVVFLELAGFDRRLGFFKTLKKLAEAREFAIPASAAFQDWIKKYVKSRGFSLENEALKKFVERLGENSEEENLYDLWQTAHYLDQLMLYRSTSLPNPPHQGEGNKKEFLPLDGGGEVGVITADDVVKIVSPNIKHGVFVLTNLFAEGRAREAVGLLERMLPAAAVDLKFEALKIIGALAGQIRSLILVKDLEVQEPSEIAKILGWKEGRVWINLRLAKKFEPSRLRQLLSDLKALDLRLKTSDVPPKLLLTLFFEKTRVYV